MLLNHENYKNGFLVDDEAIAGVTEMAGGIFAAYVSHYLSGETFAYREFDALEPALAYLHSMNRAWTFEAIGCSKPLNKAASGSECGAGSCTGCRC